MATHSELNAWLMPAKAQDEWLRLSAVLDELDDEQVPCRLDPASWWPETKDFAKVETEIPLQACRQCAARAACLDYALAADERFGIWGATLPEERRSMRWSVAKTSPTKRIMATS